MQQQQNRINAEHALPTAVRGGRIRYLITGVHMSPPPLPLPEEDSPEEPEPPEEDAPPFSSAGAARSRMVDMPVVPAARLKGHVENGHLGFGHRGQIALADKVFGKAVVGAPTGKKMLFS